MRPLALALLLVLPALAAPVPKGTEAKQYFPTTVGAKRVTALTSGGKPQEFTETVSRVEERGGSYTVTVEFEKDGSAAPDPSVFEVSANGVFRRTSGETDEKALRPLLTLGGKPGDTWEFEPAGGRGKETYTLGTEEEIEVPAGNYAAVPVVSESKQNGVTTKITTWHAIGVGVVKMQSAVRGQTTTYELKSFTPGGVKKK